MRLRNKARKIERRSIWLAMTGVCAGAMMYGSPALAGGAIDADADKILRAMTDNLKSAQEFSVDYGTDHEAVALDGQKLQYSASGKISVSRSHGFLLTRQGPYADAQVSFDGKQITVFGKRLNVFAQLDSPGPSFDDAVEEFRAATGLDATGADLLGADPYSILTDGTLSGTVVGVGFIDGVECDHLAFRTDLADWQIWITQGDKPVPLKYVITSKWITGAPQYTLRLKNWSTETIDAKLFSFVPPTDAKRLDAINADATGDIILETSE